MKRATATSPEGFTLFELMISMSLGTVVMLAVFSTYNYLGRQLTRLSYQNILESQSRKILTSLTNDVRNARSITAATPTTLSLRLMDGNSVEYTYDSSTNKLRRDPDGTGPLPPIILNYDIGDSQLQAPVSLQLPANNHLFIFVTTSGNYFTGTGGTGPTYQNEEVLVPRSIKQIAISFQLHAGTSAVQGNLGTLTTMNVTSGRMTLVNRQLPDGT